jgi:hypothetical protein
LVALLLRDCREREDNAEWRTEAGLFETKCRTKRDDERLRSALLASAGSVESDEDPSITKR